MNLFQELKRRNVVKVGLLYLVTGWLVLQVADVLFGLLSVPDWTLRFVLGILLLGMPIALVFSWVFEMTPEGIKREKDIDRSQSITGNTGRKMNQAIFGMFVLAVALLAFQIFRPVTEQPTDSEAVVAAGPTSTVAAPTAPAVDAKPSLAVLPFTNSSSDVEQSFFSDGLADSLIHVLSQIDGLTVMARTSSFAYRGKDTDLQTIARELGVQTVLEGSVQSSGDQLRIIARLVNADDGKNLWSQRFDRSRDNIFAIQDEISREVVAALKGSLLEEDRAEISQQYQPSLEAFNALLRGRQQMAMRTAESVRKSEAYFREALNYDPDYPLALVNLGDSLLLQEEYGTKPLSEVIEEVERLHRQALSLSPSLAEAYASLAMVHRARNLPEIAMSLFERAIELNPNYATAYHWQYITLRDEGKIDEAFQSITKAVALDPLSDIIQVNLIHGLWLKGRQKQSEQRLRQAIKNNPEFSGFYDALGYELFAKGQVANAYRWTNYAVEKFPGQLKQQSILCFLLAHLPDQERLNGCVRELKQLNDQRSVSAQIEAFMASGDHTSAIMMGERFIRESNAVNADYEKSLLAKSYMFAGRFEEAQALFADMHPELAEPESGNINYSNYLAAVDLGLISDRLGNADEARLRLAAALKFVEGENRISGKTIGWTDARIHAITGNRDLALKALTEAIDQGFRTVWRWDLLFDPALKPLHDDPQYQQLVAVVENDMLAQMQWLDEHPEPPTFESLLN